MRVKLIITLAVVQALMMSYGKQDTTDKDPAVTTPSFSETPSIKAQVFELIKVELDQEKFGGKVGSLDDPPDIFVQILMDGKEIFRSDDVAGWRVAFNSKKEKNRLTIPAETRPTKVLTVKIWDWDPLLNDPVVDRVIEVKDLLKPINISAKFDSRARVERADCVIQFKLKE